jgi:hypothetical protein
MAAMKATNTFSTEALEKISDWRALLLAGATLTAEDESALAGEIKQALSELAGAAQLVDVMPPGSGGTYKASELIDAALNQLHEDASAHIERSTARTKALTERCAAYKRRRDAGADAEELTRLKAGLKW